MTDQLQEKAPQKARCTIGEAFRYAASGILKAFKYGRNIKIQLAIGLFAIFLGFLLRIGAFEWIAIVICIMVVIAFETMNTALESVVDLASPEFHLLAERAKDCAAGAVLITAIGSLVVACLIFIPAALKLGGM